MSETLLSVDQARELARRVLEQAGAWPVAAEALATAIVAAELDGIPSHGLCGILGYHTEQLAAAGRRGAADPHRGIDRG